MLPVFKKVGYPYVATVLVKALGGSISVAGISGTSPKSSSMYQVHVNVGIPKYM